MKNKNKWNLNLLQVFIHIGVTQFQKGTSSSNTTTQRWLCAKSLADREKLSAIFFRFHIA